MGLVQLLPHSFAPSHPHASLRHSETTQVDVLSRQAALADLLQHRLAQQEEVLAALQVGRC